MLQTSAFPAVLRSQTSSSSILSVSSFSSNRSPGQSKTTKRSTSGLAHTITAVRSPAHQKAIDLGKRLKVSYRVSVLCAGFTCIKDLMWRAALWTHPTHHTTEAL